MLAARRTRPTVFVTGFVDLRTGQLLDLAVGRSASVVERWLAGRPGWWLDNVHAVALDPHQGYANGADRRPAADRAGRGPLPRHQVGQRVDDVRRRVQQATTGHRGRKDEPLPDQAPRHQAWEQLTDRQRDRLLEALAAGDRNGEVGTAILGKKLPPRGLRVDHHRAAGRALTAFYWHCADADVPQLRRPAGTISAWRNQGRPGEDDGEAGPDGGLDEAGRG